MSKSCLRLCNTFKKLQFSFFFKMSKSFTAWKIQGNCLNSGLYLDHFMGVLYAHNIKHKGPTWGVSRTLSNIYDGAFSKNG